MTEKMRRAAQQAALISTALDGESAVMPAIGYTEVDDNPVRMLAVGLEHAHGAISALLDEVHDLRDEVDRLSGDRPHAAADDRERWQLESR